MTRQSQKSRERFYAEQAFRSLGAGWTVLPEERENPDFIVADAERRFGLEVISVFAGNQDETGSSMKRGELITQRAIDALQDQYEASAKAKLHVRFVGAITTETMANVVRNMIALDLDSKSTGWRTIIDEQRGLRVHITKGFRSDWYAVNHRVGWIDRAPRDIIARATRVKSGNIDRYRAAVGDDVRLLLVADAVQNSGKLRLESNPGFDHLGFRQIYFFPYPEKALVLLGKA
jgi:hypothetical protein